MENNLPLISVIIPAYNSEKTVADSIRSVLNQTYQNIEVIVVNDGSTDKTAEIVGKISNENQRVKFVDCKINGGIAAARNEGLAACLGEWLTFMDSDDTANEKWLENMYSAAIENGAEIAVSGHLIKFTDKDIPYVPTKSLTVLDSKTAFEEILRHRKLNNSACTKLFKREVFDGILFPKGRAFEDVATTWKTVLKANKIVCIPNTDYNYFMRNGSISHVKSVKNSVNMFEAFCESYEYAKENRPELLPIATSNLLHGAWKSWVSMGYKKDLSYLPKLKEIAEFSKSVVSSPAVKKLSKVERIKATITCHPSGFYFFTAKILNAISSKKRNEQLG